jgi:anti-sigma regulatory factor (Ser/Thr protein kinase)
MSLPARAENVAVVRHALAGLAEELGMDEATAADLKTVVTEACMNAVVHAYPGDRPGPLEVEALPAEGGLTVVVRDFGSGIQPRPDVAERSSLRIGLALIAALSASFEIRGGTDRGTEIRMHLRLRAAENQDDGGGGEEPHPAPAETALRVDSPELLAPVLGRALAALAARHEITVDRISDAMLLSDAIAAGAPRGFADGAVRLSVLDSPAGVRLRVGPMRGGAAARLRESLELPELERSLADLADEVEVERDERGEFLVLGIAALAG